MGAGAERLPGVDDDVDVRRRGGLPRGPHPEPLADEQRLVEVLPAVGPVVGDLGRADLDQPVPGRGLELAERGQLALGAVDRVLDVAGPVLLLDAARREHDELGEHPLRELRAAADGEPDHPNGSAEGAPHAGEEALGLAVAAVQVLGAERLVEALGQLALLLAEAAGNDDVEEDVLVAAVRAARGPAARARAAPCGRPAECRPGPRRRARRRASQR